MSLQPFSLAPGAHVSFVTGLGVFLRKAPLTHTPRGMDSHKTGGLLAIGRLIVRDLRSTRVGGFLNACEVFVLRRFDVEKVSKPIHI